MHGTASTKSDREVPKTAADLSPFEWDLLDQFQRDFPLSPHPFAEIADRFGVTEERVMAALASLKKAGFVSRVGAVVAPHRAGWSTLAAMAVPSEQLEATADLISRYDEVNHNYEREHRLSLWFVITGCDRDNVTSVLDEIEAQTGYPILVLPLIEAYHIDLGFTLKCD